MTTVTTAIAAHAPDSARVLVCGGGTANTALMQALATRLRRPVESTARHGVDPQWVEPMAFAWLARETLERRPGNLPGVTGSRGPRVLGTIAPG